MKISSGTYLETDNYKIEIVKYAANQNVDITFYDKEYHDIIRSFQFSKSDIKNVIDEIKYLMEYM